MDASYGRRVAEFLGAILAGNAVYFFLLAPRLPAAWGHQPFAFDRGLVLDFFLCVAPTSGCAGCNAGLTWAGGVTSAVPT